MNALTIFGLIAVILMLVFYALEKRSRWYILGFAVACVLGSTYGFLQGAWPFGVIEAAVVTGCHSALVADSQIDALIARAIPLSVWRLYNRFNG